MKIDYAIETFLEKYDRKAVDSIKVLSEDFGLNINKATIEVYPVKEAFTEFQNYLKGYGKYLSENVNNEDASPIEAVEKRSYEFVESGIKILPDKIQYNQLQEYVQSYLEGVESLLVTVESVKQDMIFNDVDPAAVGTINDYCDKFMEKVDPLFEKSMDDILWASGYKSNQILIEKTAKPIEKETHVFL